MTRFAHRRSQILWLFAPVFLVGPSHALDITSLPSGHSCRSTLHVGCGRTLFRCTGWENEKPRNQPASLALALSRGGETSQIDTPRASGVLSYYLLWSPGIFKKTMYSLITLMVLRQASKPFHDQLDVLVEQTASLPFAFILQLVILPVMSSACCGIQLAINALVGAGGCAGFNKYLGPLRPYFLALLFFATGTSVPYHQSRNVMIRWIGYSVLRWFVALMPEMVYLWNVRAVAAGNITRKRRAEHNGEADTLVTTIEMTIPTMGCVACINKIDASMRRCAPDQIKEAKSWLEPSKQGGRALVRAVASTKEEADRLAQTLVNAVRDAGFQTCALDSIQIEHGSD